MVSVKYKNLEYYVDVLFKKNGITNFVGILHNGHNKEKPFLRVVFLPKLPGIPITRKTLFVIRDQDKRLHVKYLLISIKITTQSIGIVNYLEYNKNYFCLILSAIFVLKKETLYCCFVSNYSLLFVFFTPISNGT